jgi:hypothetical protein
MLSVPLPARTVSAHCLPTAYWLDTDDYVAKGKIRSKLCGAVPNLIIIIIIIIINNNNNNNNTNNTNTNTNTNTNDNIDRQPRPSSLQLR